MKTESQPGYFFTIDSAYGPEEIKEKGSRFIGYLYPVSSVEEAEGMILQLRKRYHDASHVCFAFRLGSAKEEYFRCSDDGEPSGTAGLPIYNEMKGKDYLNVLAVVVRYFGGTKLGTGGLARTYAAAARNVINTAKTITITIKKQISLNFPFQRTGEIMTVVQRFSLEIIKQEYTPRGVSMKLAVPVNRWEEVINTLSHLGKGQLTFL